MNRIIEPQALRGEQSAPTIIFSAIRQIGMAYQPRFGEDSKSQIRHAAEKQNGGPAPYTLRMQGFGAAVNAKWDYTNKPGIVYFSGTCVGGVWITPPEILSDSVKTPENTTTATVLLHDDVALGWGEPASDGSTQDGPKLETTGSSGSRDLALTFSDDSGSSRDGLLKIDGLAAIKERSGAPTMADGYSTVYVDTDDGHLKSTWNDGGTTKTRTLTGLSDWAASTYIAAGELIHQDGLTFRCNTGHTSGTNWSANKEKFDLVANGVRSL